MSKSFRYSFALGALAGAAAFGSLALPAPAALDMADGPRRVVTTLPLSACNDAAKAALTEVFTGAQELGSGTGEWQAIGAGDTANGSTSAAAIHCYPLDKGFVATFTCAAQVPPYPDSAATLCTKLSAAFDAKTGSQAMLPSGSGRR